MNNIDVSTWFVVHAGHIEVVKDLEFLKPCKLNAHTAGCYCIAMDPLDRYFVFFHGSLFISYYLCDMPTRYIWITPWVLVIYTRLVGLSSLLFELTLSNEHYKCFMQMVSLLVTLIPIMTSPS